MDSRRDRVDRLIDRIEQINNYLIAEAQLPLKESRDLNSVGDDLNTAKPVIKIVSPSNSLADKFKQKSLANSQLRSRYEFQTVAPIKNIHEIIEHCDLICLIYYFKNTVKKHHQKLVELAIQNNIDSIVLVRQPDRNIKNATLSSWLKTQDFLLDKVQLPLDKFINLNQSSDIEIYHQLLLRSHESVETKFIARHQQRLKTLIEVFFDRHIASIDPLYPLLDKSPHHYRPQLEQISNRIKPEKQQLTTRIKQHINHLRLDLLNLFTTESLIFSVRQIIDLATVKIVLEAEVTYLYLTVNNSVSDIYIHDYIIEFCQQKLEEIIAFQWSQIEYVYGGGLNSLIAKVNEELKTITNLVNLEDDLFLSSPVPRVNVSELIDVECLKDNSKIVFDYHFTQGSWFRLFISVLIGLGIYLFTWAFFGGGKYIGFAIIIFQIVNLITGQDPKKAKLKQHSKELKRHIDRQYQILVRLVVDKLIQTLITAVESQKLDPDELETAIALAQTKLKRSPTYIAQTEEIANLQQQKAKILSWLD